MHAGRQARSTTTAKRGSCARPAGAREKNRVEVDGRDEAVNEYKREEEARCKTRTQPRMRKGRETEREKENMAADIRGG